MTSAIRQTIDDRAEPRDEVYHRTRLTTAGGRTASTTLVNLSPGGFMARADADLAAGEAVSIVLPVVGMAPAVIRWSLGGRIGCQFAAGIDPRRYRALLAAVGG